MGQFPVSVILELPVARSYTDTSPGLVIPSADPTGAVNPEYSHIVGL